MPILSPTNLETADYGTVGWNAIYSSNFQKLNDYLKRFDMSRNAITYASSITYNCATSNLQSVTLTGNTTISFSNGFAGGKFYLIIKQDATGGRTVSWGSMVRFPSGVNNAIDTTANAVTLLGFIFNDADNKYDCFLNSYGLSSSDILNRLLIVDGSGSNLDADLLDGFNASQTPTANTIPVSDSAGALSGWKTKDVTETLQTLSISGGSISWNLSLGNVAQVTLTSNATLSNPTNLKSGGTYILIVKQDATGGRTLSFESNYKFPSSPTIDSGANKVTVFTFVSDGSVLYGSWAGGY